MSTKKMFCVYDSKTEIYGIPFCMITRGEAVRGFTDVCNDPTTSICKYPADYTLFEIGEYDDAKGVITSYETKINLGLGVEFQKNPLPKVAAEEKFE